ncbi:hypothetical protein ACWFRM_03320 [Streptomyces sp. NPDC055144]
MSDTFRGVINLDVRDSVPDRAPYGQAEARETALYAFTGGTLHRVAVDVQR